MAQSRINLEEDNRKMREKIYAFTAKDSLLSIKMESTEVQEKDVDIVIEDNAPHDFQRQMKDKTSWPSIDTTSPLLQICKTIFTLRQRMEEPKEPLRSC